MSQTITIAGMRDVLGVSRMTLHRMRKNGEIPEPIPTKRRVIRWDRSQIELWQSWGYPTAAEFEKRKLAQRKLSRRAGR